MSEAISKAADRTELSYKAARVVAEVLNPPWVGIAVLGAVAFHTTDTLGQFIRWWAIASFFTSLLPVGFLIQALRRGSVSDWYVTRARERLAPFSFAVPSVGVAAVVMVVFSAPEELLAVTLAGMAGLLVAIGVTPWWKLSIHAGCTAGGVVVLGLGLSPWALLLAPAIPLVGWSRIRVAHHTVNQAVMGGVVGAITAAAVFSIVVAVA